MGDLTRRLERLEGRHLLRAPVPPRPLTEQDRRARWLARAKLRRHDATYSREENQAGDVFRLLRLQGRIPETAEELHAQLLAWRPPLDARAVERVLARTIYEREEGTAGMACPQEWRESFEAAEVLLERCLAAPDETLAEVLVAAEEWRGEDAHEGLQALGITPELAEWAVGPDLDEIPDEERDRRLREILADFYYGAKGYEVQRHITRLVSESERRTT